MPDVADAHFNCTPRDRMLFETGIKLGAIYHQYVGIPLRPEMVGNIERAIEESVKVQPFVVSAKVKVDTDRLKETQGMYGYGILTGDLLDVTVTLEKDGLTVVGRMRYVPELDYPLMYVDSVTGENTI